MRAEWHGCKGHGGMRCFTKGHVVSTRVHDSVCQDRSQEWSYDRSCGRIGPVLGAAPGIVLCPVPPSVLGSSYLLVGSAFHDFPAGFGNLEDAIPMQTAKELFAASQHPSTLLL